MAIRKITFAAVIAAVYAGLTMSTAFMAYGPIQFRIAEALCILPFFFPFSMWGLFVGCILANLLSMYGPVDIVFGSMATLLAAFCTMQLGRRTNRSIGAKIAACFPPVIFNTVIIGAVIAWYMTQTGGAFLPAMVINGLQVGFGELVVMYALGLPLMIFLPKMQAFKSLTDQYSSLAQTR